MRSSSKHTARLGRVFASCGLGLAVVAAMGATPEVARACAMQCHMYMCEQAIYELPPGELKDLMTRPEMLDIVYNGSYFPDSGYGANDAYGEWSHWEPFAESYIDWMKKSLEGPFTEGRAAEHAVFMMTSVCHGLGDMTFDTMLYQRQKERDPAPRDPDLDAQLDIWFIDEYERDYVAPVWVPAEEMSELFRD